MNYMISNIATGLQSTTLPACHIGLVLARAGAARGAHAEAAFSDAYCCWGASMCAGFTHPPPPPLPPHTLWWL